MIIGSLNLSVSYRKSSIYLPWGYNEAEKIDTSQN